MLLSKPAEVPHSHLVVAGRLPDFSNIVFSREEIITMGKTLIETVDLLDVLFLTVLSFLIVPFARIFHSYWYANEYKTKNIQRTDSGSSDDKNADSFKSTYTYHAAHNMSQIAMIAMIVYAIDCLVIVGYLQGIEFILTEDIDFGYMVARILYTTWLGFRCMKFKRYLLGRVINRSPEKLGKALVYDRILDWMIYAILAFSIMDTLNIEIGAGLKSVFALSGVGTLVLSLASKDMASLFVSGVALSSTDKFRVGDFIKLGDNTTGVVSRMGIMFTEVRGKTSRISVCALQCAPCLCSTHNKHILQQVAMRSLQRFPIHNWQISGSLICLECKRAK